MTAQDLVAFMFSNDFKKIIMLMIKMMMTIMNTLINNNLKQHATELFKLNYVNTNYGVKGMGSRGCRK